MEKCEFVKSKIEFFGFVVSDNGVSPDPKKVADLHDAKVPHNLSEIRSFLDMAQFCAMFINMFATISEPLHDLTKRRLNEDGVRRRRQHSREGKTA